MGRTLATYRIRLNTVQDRLSKILKRMGEYNEQLWVATHRLSAPASNFPWPDTHAVASWCMVLELIKELLSLEREVNDYLQNHI